MVSMLAWTIVPEGAWAATLLGLSTQVPAKIVYLSDGPNQKVQVGTIRVEKPLIERAAANAEIARLVAMRDAVPASDSKRRDELKAQVERIEGAEGEAD